MRAPQRAWVPMMFRVKTPSPADKLVEQVAKGTSKNPLRFELFREGHLASDKGARCVGTAITGASGYSRWACAIGCG